ncbi:hypothetical protein N7530_005092 [Penicillium desertorum]|uniref:Uncharacterized protein n=1 Tax=Penicillium desertorum TaxID=1303715 RepID=A0A9W9WZD4_9EURO|nr:hypothetical protein N7530_005092 [Penicillium desertorum]
MKSNVLSAPSFALMPRRVKRGVWNSRLQNQSGKIGLVLPLKYCGAKGQSPSHRPSASLFFSSIILYYPSIAFGLLLFSALVELGTWYAGRCNLIYHHY